MTISLTVTAEELKELEAALSAHHRTLQHELAQGVYTGGPNEAGIQKCIRRQGVEALLDKVRGAGQKLDRVQGPVAVPMPERLQKAA